jgi:hypothetical protein
MGNQPSFSIEFDEKELDCIAKYHPTLCHTYTSSHTSQVLRIYANYYFHSLHQALLEHKDSASPIEPTRLSGPIEASLMSNTVISSRGETYVVRLARACASHEILRIR